MNWAKSTILKTYTKKSPIFNSGINPCAELYFINIFKIKLKSASGFNQHISIVKPAVHLKKKLVISSKHHKNVIIRSVYFAII